MHDVGFYLDFISPYTWMALMRAEDLGRERGIRWEPRPVVLAVLLGTHGLVGPVEVPAKRRYSLHDIVRCADELGLTIVGPPEHPFRSLEALRTLTLFRDDERALRLTVALSDAAWGRGRDLTDLAVLEDVVATTGLDATDLRQRIGTDENKRALHAATDEAIACGVFGVPTFAVGDELFWGHDRLGQLLGRLQGTLPPPHERAEAMIARPMAVVRRRPSGGRER